MGKVIKKEPSGKPPEKKKDARTTVKKTKYSRKRLDQLNIASKKWKKKRKEQFEFFKKRTSELEGIQLYAQELEIKLEYYRGRYGDVLPWAFSSESINPIPDVYRCGLQESTDSWGNNCNESIGLGAFLSSDHDCQPVNHTEFTYPYSLHTPNEQVVNGRELYNYVQETYMATVKNLCKPSYTQSLRSSISSSTIAELASINERAIGDMKQLCSKLLQPSASSNFQMLVHGFHLSLSFSKRSWDRTLTGVSALQPSEAIQERFNYFINDISLCSTVYFSECFPISDNTNLVNTFSNRPWDVAMYNSPTNTTSLVTRWVDSDTGDHYLLVHSINDHPLVLSIDFKEVIRMRTKQIIRASRAIDSEGHAFTTVQSFTTTCYEDNRELDPPSFKTGSFQAYMEIDSPLELTENIECATQEISFHDIARMIDP